MSTKKSLTTCAPKTAVAYARYSSAQQRDVSIEQQLNDIRAYAEREGYTIIHEYADRAKSGYKRSERRFEFQAMLRAAESGQFDCVIAWKVDRFGRNRRESSMYKGQLADLGVKVVYAMEPIPDGAAGVLTEGMLEAIAEWYSRNLSENVKRGKHDNAKKCLYNGVTVYGYKKGEDGRYAINETEAAVVRRVFSLYAQGYSVVKISHILEDEGLRSPKGHPFAHSRITYMICNEVYIGVYKFDGVYIPGGLPAIIDRDTWEICQALRKKTARHVEKCPVDFVLTGRCSCGICGANVRGASGSSGTARNIKYYYYVCAKKHMGKMGNCDLPYIRKEKMEDRIINFLYDNVLTGPLKDNFVNCVSETLEAQHEVSIVRQMEKELEDINKRIENINKAISEGVWSKTTASMLDTLTKQSEELEKDIAFQRINESKTISKERIDFYFDKIAKGKLSDPIYLKALISNLINSIVVFKNWLMVVINAQENVARIPQSELPLLESVPDISQFVLQPNGPNRLVTVEPYPVIVFKIAI